MYGKHYESTYTGSMYGAGLAVFAVWGYVIAHTRAGSVELNPKQLADTLGGSVEEVAKAIEFLCSPDPASRCKDSHGSRLVKEGQFQYKVPSYEIYRELRDEDDRREYNRRKQQEYRQKKKGGGSMREQIYVKQQEDGVIDNDGVPIKPNIKESPGAT